MTQHTGNYIPLVLSPQVLWPSPNLQTGTPLDQSCPVEVPLPMGGKGVGRHHPPLGRPVTTLHQEHTTLLQQIQQAKLEPGEVMASYYVKALFTSVPLDPSINKFQQKIKQDSTLHDRTNMSIPHTMQLLEFCLKSTYFLFQVKYNEQANLFMEKFEVKALSTAPHHPGYG